MTRTAVVHYDESIEIAQSQLSRATTAEEKAGFAQQLGHRLFNRGLFLLLVANDGCAPENAKQLALLDLAKARQLDDEVRDFWLDRKLLLLHSVEYFCRLSRRAIGLLDFYDDDEVRAIWDVAEVVEDADRFLFAAWDQPSAPLFINMNRIGRLQQLESLAILLDIRRGRTMEAVRLAMRMLVEDENILECPFRMAATALLNFTRDDEWSDAWSQKTKSSMRVDLRTMLRTCRETYLDVRPSNLFAPS